MISNDRIKYFKTLYKQDDVISFAEILAVMDKESSGNEFFVGNERLFKDNMAAAERITGATRKDILDVVYVADKKYLKFRCEPSIYKLVVKNCKKFTLPKDRFMLSSSLGVGQKLMYYWLARHEPDQSKWMNRAEQFGADVQLQVKTMTFDLRGCYAAAKGNRALAYSFYNAGTGIKKPTAYGIAVAELVEKYEEVLKV